jgi:hypothetical protein
VYLGDATNLNPSAAQAGKDLVLGGKNCVQDLIVNAGEGYGPKASQAV